MKSTELIRIKNLINVDRFKSSDVFLDLLKKDLKKLLTDYFDINGDVKIAIVKEKNCFSVSINLLIDRIKGVGSLPN